MANKEHLNILMQGVGVWNTWRRENTEIEPDLSEANLRKMDFVDIYLSRTNLVRADLSKSNLSGANLGKSNLVGANLSSANLNGAILSVADLSDAELSGTYLGEAYLNATNLSRANLTRADMRAAHLTNANLTGANLTGTKLKGANLSSARLVGATIIDANLSEAKLNRANLTEAIIINTDLQGADLVQTNLKLATINDCNIYGINAWNLILEDTKQTNLIVTRDDESTVTVDDIEVAQFIYLLLNNEKIRNVINTITSKAVLILGRFTPERKLILDNLRDRLRKFDYLPILFDFEKPKTRNLQETVTTLARLARFIIADITDPKSIPQELISIVQSLPSVPVQPLLKRGSEPWAMYDHISMYPWVLPLHYYEEIEDLLDSLEEKVIKPAEIKSLEVEQKHRAVDELINQ